MDVCSLFWISIKLIHLWLAHASVLRFWQRRKAFSCLFNWSFVTFLHKSLSGKFLFQSFTQSQSLLLSLMFMFDTSLHQRIVFFRIRVVQSGVQYADWMTKGSYGKQMHKCKFQMYLYIWIYNNKDIMLMHLFNKF